MSPSGTERNFARSRLRQKLKGQPTSWGIYPSVKFLAVAVLDAIRGSTGTWPGGIDTVVPDPERLFRPARVKSAYAPTAAVTAADIQLGRDGPIPIEVQRSEEIKRR
jgi:hypothetical protein